MAKTETFNVSKRGQETYEVALELPENLDDPRWGEIVDGDAAEVIHTLALRGWIIACQSHARGEYENGPEAVQQAAEEYVYGVRRTGSRKPKVKMDADAAKDLKFSKEQLEALRAAGVSFGGDEEDEG